MQKFNRLFKIILELCLIFLIFYVWLNFYLKDSMIAGVISLFMAGVIEGVIQTFRLKKFSTSNMKVKEKEDAEKMFVSLVNSNNQIIFFANLFSLRYKQIEKHKDYILITTEKQKLLIFPFLKFRKLSSDDILLSLKKVALLKPTKVIFICGECEQNALDYIKSSEVIILNKYQTYLSIYKEYEYFPKIENIKIPRKTFKDIISLFFNYSHAKGFILSSLFLLLSSFFTKMNLYYLVSSSALMLFGFICLFNKKEKPIDFSI